MNKFEFCLLHIRDEVLQKQHLKVFVSHGPVSCMQSQAQADPPTAAGNQG